MRTASKTTIKRRVCACLCLPPILTKSKRRLDLSIKGRSRLRRAVLRCAGKMLLVSILTQRPLTLHKQGKGSPYSISERRVPELITVLSSQTAGDVSHKPGGRLPLLSARPAVTLTTLAANFAAW